MITETIKMIEIEGRTAKIILNRAWDVTIVKIGKKCWKASLAGEVFGVARTRQEAIEALGDSLMRDQAEDDNVDFVEDVIYYE